MFPKTWSETNNSLISDLIKNPELLLWQRTGSAVYTFFGCLFELFTPVQSRELRNTKCAHILCKLPMSTFIYCRQTPAPENILTAARVLTSEQLSFERVRFIFAVNPGPFRGEETREIQVDLECSASPHWDKSATDKTDDCQGVSDCVISVSGTETYRICEESRLLI